jgi:hypothetical protein
LYSAVQVTKEANTSSALKASESLNIVKQQFLSAIFYAISFRNVEPEDP